MVASGSTTYSVPNTKAVLKNAKGATLVSGVSDDDGWFILSYKWTGKAATFYVTVTLSGTGAKPLTKTISLKANGYVEADFTTP